jgi:hypothetical protein
MHCHAPCTGMVHAASWHSYASPDLRDPPLLLQKQPQLLLLRQPPLLLLLRQPPVLSLMHPTLLLLPCRS